MSRLTSHFKYDGIDRAFAKNFDDLDFLQEVANKLGEHEDIEEKLGIDLITLFKALTDGIWFKYDSSKPIIFVEPYDVYPTKGSYLRIFNSEILEFKDYGKAWALTREELENE